MPPSAIVASAMPSSPENTLNERGSVCSSSVICAMFPLDSLMPMMFFSSASRCTVAGSRFVPLREGMLYSRIGRSTACAIARKC